MLLSTEELVLTMLLSTEEGMLLPTEDICVHVNMLLSTEDSMLICCYLLRNLY